MGARPEAGSDFPDTRAGRKGRRPLTPSHRRARRDWAWSALLAGLSLALVTFMMGQDIWTDTRIRSADDVREVTVYVDQVVKSASRGFENRVPYGHYTLDGVTHTDVPLALRTKERAWLPQRVLVIPSEPTVVVDVDRPKLPYVPATLLVLLGSVAILWWWVRNLVRILHHDPRPSPPRP